MSVQVKADSVVVSGKTSLHGEVNVQGSKNAVLPLLSALVLVPRVELTNVPDLSDINVMVDILKYLGAEGSFTNGVVKLNLEKIRQRPISEDFSSKLRASSLFMGPLLGKFGEARVGMPGGCAIGSRPMDIHLEGFKKLGAEITLDSGNMTAKTEKGLSGEYTLPLPSVGATQNLITASVISDGEVRLNNVAIEPEVFELINFLNDAGAKITFKNPKSLHIVGVSELKPVEFKVQPDRIEAFTLLVAGVATKGRVKIKNCEPEHLTAPLQALSDMGVGVKIGKDWIEATYVGPLKGIKVETGVYPSFPTDCQQQISVLMSIAETPSVLTEKVFNSRFRHLDEMMKMGADIKVTENNVAIINPSQLRGCRLDSYDLRGAASMIIAGMVAEGVTTVNSLRYLYRGYDSFVEKLNYIGAEISYK